MNRRPTPETDAAVIPWNGDYVVWHGFARRMECERDEAIEKYNTLAVENMLEVHSLCKERNELRDILQKLIGIIPEPECNDFGHKKEEQHSLFEKCPVLERYDAIIKQAKTILEKA